MTLHFPVSAARQSRAAFIRGLLTGLRHIPQISHPKTGEAVRSRYEHTQNMCQLARLLNADFDKRLDPLWPQLCIRLACHDIGHTPYGHAGERVIQTLYDPSFSNSKQSKRYMFVGVEDWPDGVMPFAWYRSAPIEALAPELEGALAALVDFFDDLENAVGDAIDLRTLGHPIAHEFLTEGCSWSNHVERRPELPLAQYLRQVVTYECSPTSFHDLISHVKDGLSECLLSIAKLREIITSERLKCSRIAEIDALADRRIPALFENAIRYLRRAVPGECGAQFLRKVAVDIIASTNELELA